MAGKDMVVSGAMNKVQVATSAIMPDEMVADQTKKKQEPVKEDNKK